VRHDDNLCLSYRARLDGPYLVVEVKLEPGWHTFAMDNKLRAEEKLAGRKSLGIDHPTEFKLTGATVVEGPWYQTPPKDFSKPELRWFSWGFAQEARFAAKVRRSSAAPAKLTFRGQACTETVCKNIVVTMSLPVSRIGRNADSSDAALKNLKDLTALQTLTLSGSQVTDEWLEGLKELKNLQALSLNQTRVTGAGLRAS
jgi:hypothetical protein